MKKDPQIVYNQARSNLLLVGIFSIVNVILIAVDAGISFMFSAYFPMFCISLGSIAAFETGMNAPYVIGLAVAVIVSGLYILFYFLAKKHPSLMLVSLILFIIDTLFIIWLITFGFDISMIVDILFHAWVLYYLITGVIAWNKLKNMPPEPVAEAQDESFKQI